MNEQVYNQYYDTGGNYHWTGVHSGEHILWKGEKMGEMMTFPATWEEYEELYGFTDKEQVYTNGSRLIQSFRVRQWLDHLERNRGEWLYLYEDNYKCSICGSWWCCIDDSQMDEMNYCPNCGSDMRGDEDDN